MSRSKKAIALVGLVSLMGLGSMLSMSYFTDHETMTNDFTTGSLDIKETETVWDNNQDGQNIYPGFTVDKNPVVQNVTGIADNPAYIKAQITFRDSKGNKITDEARRNLIMYTIRYDAANTGLKEGTKYEDKTVKSYPNVNPDFEYIRYEAGVYTYYLKAPLASAATKEGGESKTFFNKITLPQEWSQTELDVMGDYSIEVEFTAIQSKTFKDVYDAMKSLDGEIVHESYDRK